MKTIGYWKSLEEPDLPMPVATDCPVDSEFIQRLQDSLIKEYYWTSPYTNAQRIGYMGYSRCRICNKLNGDSDIILVGSYTSYTFPDGLIHYYRDHNVSADPEFVAFIKGFRLQRLPADEYEHNERAARYAMRMQRGMAGLCYQ